MRTVPGTAVPGLIGAGELDLGLMVSWPGSAESDLTGIESLSLVREDLLAVGGATRGTAASVHLQDLVSGLLIAGPHAESEAGLKSLLRTETNSPVLAHSVADVLTGLRIAAITGGTMVLPRSMAEVGSTLAVRPLEPPVSIETVLLASTERSTDPVVFDLVVALSEAMGADVRMKLGASANR